MRKVPAVWHTSTCDSGSRLSRATKSKIFLGGGGLYTFLTVSLHIFIITVVVLKNVHTESLSLSLLCCVIHEHCGLAQLLLWENCSLGNCNPAGDPFHAFPTQYFYSYTLIRAASYDSEASAGPEYSPQFVLCLHWAVLARFKLSFAWWPLAHRSVNSRWVGLLPCSQSAVVEVTISTSYRANIRKKSCLKK